MTRSSRRLPWLGVLAIATAQAAAPAFDVTETSVAGIHEAIRAGTATCQDIVRGYLDRARAYNGSCTALVTPDGRPVKAQPGALRGGAPLRFPRETVAVTKVLPDFARYTGTPIEFGRLAPTASDPAAYAQYGMVVGRPGAGQLAALATLNVRGERSVTCKGRFDAPPASGPLPPDAPVPCEAFRQQPDALELAAQYDAKYGRDPDLSAMPMYCIAFSVKDALDTRDMRSTSGADVAYAMDAPPRDATIVGRLRSRGAIILAKANLAEYNGGSGDPGGEKPAKVSLGAGAASTWGGTACNAYDTEFETGGSSSGSAVSVSASLAHCSICEETGGSCRQPAWRNGVVGLVTTKGLMAYGGAVGGDPYVDRPGLVCRSVDDAARALDALRDPVDGYFDPRDPYSALPRGLAAREPYANATRTTGLGERPLAGLRVGIVREYMVRHAKNDEAVSDRVDAEIKRVLRDQLGAELVETRDPQYPDDPDVPDVAFGLQQALAEVLPLHLPEYLAEKKKDGTWRFPVDGEDPSSRDYLVRLSTGRAPLSPAINFRSINQAPRNLAFSLHLAQYLAQRGDARVRDWVSLNANATYESDSRRAAMLNWGAQLDTRADGTGFRMKMRDAARMALAKFMLQNRIDVLVNPTITLPPVRIGHANQPTVADRPNGRFPTAANLGIPEITVPAGFNDVVYEPQYRLNEAGDAYVEVANDTAPTRLQVPLPFGMSFWSGPGEEATILKVAAIYEAATKHRRPPAAFGPLRRAGQ